jgi:hypothetical protein
VSAPRGAQNYIFARGSNGGFLPQESRKCFIFQSGLTDTLSSTLESSPKHTDNPSVLIIEA